jgi:chaperonin cofactor prefoldin
MRKMYVETHADPNIMISKLKNVRETINELVNGKIGINTFIHKGIYRGSLENVNQVIKELEVLQEDMNYYEDLGNN